MVLALCGSQKHLDAQTRLLALLLLCCIGVAVRVLALKTLGEYFSAYVTLQPNHRLVRHGIYASIRHPLYLSLLLAPTGMALVFASPLALPILALAAIFVLDRIRKEEHLFAAHFGWGSKTIEGVLGSSFRLYYEKGQAQRGGVL